MRVLIKKGRVVDPADNIDSVQDILVDGGKIAKVAPVVTADADEVIDAAGKIVIPGLVDMHVHLREPGREDKETVASGTAAAAKGGVTSVLAMPNTDPAIDSAAHVMLLEEIIEKTARVNVFIAAAITKNRQGRRLTGITALKRAGICAITDDGASVDSEALMSAALRAAKRSRLVVIGHCEDTSLSGAGVVNLGFISTRLGLRGIPRESEYRRVERDIRLAQKTRARLHIAHVSCKESVEVIRAAKKRGVAVTAETAPHYLALSEEALLNYDTNMKMNPPLRQEADRQALRDAVRSGIIDVIASDHAPHTENEKDIEFDRAAFGVVGLETTLAVCATELIRTRLLSWPELVMRLATAPSRILGIDKGTLRPGADADIAIVAADQEWVVRKEGLVSKSKNSPFLGRTLYGTVEYTLCAGKIVYRQ